MEKTSFVLKGDICWSASPRLVETVENGFLPCVDGKAQGVFKKVPDQYTHLPVTPGSEVYRHKHAEAVRAVQRQRIGVICRHSLILVKTARNSPELKYPDKK